MEKTIKGEVSRSISLSSRFNSVDFYLCDHSTGTAFSKNLPFYHSELHSENSLCFYWEESNQLLGFLFYRVMVDELEIIHWAVREKGQGWGSAFFKTFLQQISKEVKIIHLEVDLSNMAAIKIYESFQFEKTNVRKNYYGPERDAIIYMKNID